MNLRICWMVILMTSKPQFGGEKVKLSDLCGKGKSSLRQKDLLNDGPYLVYGASGVIGTMSCYQNEMPYVAVVKDGAGVGRAMACEGRSSVLGTMQALLPSENVDLNYLLHLVRSLKLGDGFSGSTIPHIYFRDYGEREVPAISFEQQTMIAAVFGQIERQLSNLDGQISVCRDVWRPLLSRSIFVAQKASALILRIKDWAFWKFVTQRRLYFRRISCCESFSYC